MTRPETATTTAAAAAIRDSQVTIHQLSSPRASLTNRSRTNSILPPPTFSPPSIHFQAIHEPVDPHSNVHHLNSHTHHRPSIQLNGHRDEKRVVMVNEENHPVQQHSRNSLPLQTEAQVDQKEPDGLELLHTYYYADGGLSDEEHTAVDDLNEQILEEDRRRLKQLGLEE